jgi:hypothetical protein
MAVLCYVTELECWFTFVIKSVGMWLCVSSFWVCVCVCVCVTFWMNLIPLSSSVKWTWWKCVQVIHACIPLHPQERDGPSGQIETTEMEHSELWQKDPFYLQESYWLFGIQYLHKVHSTDWYLKAASHHHMTHKVSVILTSIYLNNNTSDYMYLANKRLSSEEVSSGRSTPPEGSVRL